jgi:transglutaminase-like putative cysteine protease
MGRHLVVRHTTEYHYAEPVIFGRHRLMFRPRDSHSIRLLDTSLTITPKPQHVRWAYDPFGNSVTFVEFDDSPSPYLAFTSEIRLVHYEVEPPTELLLASATKYPFAYAPDELPDLQSINQMHRPDPEGRVANWADAIVRAGDRQTLSVLKDMMAAIRRDVRYQRRQTPGTQDPVTTLELGSGTCRDLALLMIEALRSLGIAARFVSGYIYSPNRVSRQGAGATHAWVQVYLPGCGWVEMDPTNAIFGNRDLIRVAVARDHKQALPLSGSFVGRRSAYRGMTVTVNVTTGDAKTSVA